LVLQSLKVIRRNKEDGQPVNPARRETKTNKDKKSSSNKNKEKREKKKTKQ